MEWIKNNYLHNQKNREKSEVKLKKREGIQRNIHLSSHSFIPKAVTVTKRVPNIQIEFLVLCSFFSIAEQNRTVQTSSSLARLLQTKTRVQLKYVARKVVIYSFRLGFIFPLSTDSDISIRFHPLRFTSFFTSIPIQANQTSHSTKNTRNSKYSMIRFNDLIRLVGIYSIWKSLVVWELVVCLAPFW